MVSEDTIKFESSLLLLSVVKILSDYGLNKTLKKLRRETNSDHLRKEKLPDFIANTNFEKLIPKLLKKSIKSSKNKKYEDTISKSKNISEKDSKVLPGFVKSQTLEGTIETPKRNNSVTYTSTTPSNNFITSNNSFIDSKNTETVTINGKKSGVPFKRINDEVWLSKIDKEELKNNTYKPNLDLFASKDAEQLNSVKGKDFRSQKYKKKRSSWKGSGEITNSVNSVIFSDSDS